MNMKLKEEYIKIMNDIKDGATVWSRTDAMTIREIQKEHPDWVDIVDDMEELEYILDVKFDGAKKLPFFGAILTDEGKKHLEST